MCVASFSLYTTEEANLVKPKSNICAITGTVQTALRGRRILEILLGKRHTRLLTFLGRKGPDSKYHPATNKAKFLKRTLMRHVVLDKASQSVPYKIILSAGTECRHKVL